AGPVNLFGRQELFFDFESERAESEGGDDLTSRTSLRADGVVAPSETIRLPASLSSAHELRRSGRQELEISGRISTAYQRFTASNTVDAN
ncbi:hypothetical protein DF186_16655, partial [Enterococcus hirae]